MDSDQQFFLYNNQCTFMLLIRKNNPKNLISYDQISIFSYQNVQIWEILYFIMLIWNKLKDHLKKIYDLVFYFSESNTEVF